jgi:hypothetical protein
MCALSCLILPLQSIWQCVFYCWQKTINALEPRLTRHGYNAKTLAELLDTKPAEIRSFLQGNLTPARPQELQNNLLAIGIPL